MPFRSMLALRVLLVLCGLSLSQESWASDSRFFVDGTVGYRFGGAHSVDWRADGQVRGDGRLTVKGAVSYGALFAFRVQPDGTIFLNYSRQETTLVSRIRSSHPETGDELNDVFEGRGSIEYFQFGGNLERRLGLLVPYVGVSVGLTRIAALSGGGGAQARFNVTLDGGVRFEVLPYLDLRLFGRAPFTLPGSTLFCYSESSCVDASNPSPFVQGEIQAGLGLRF